MVSGQYLLAVSTLGTKKVGLRLPGKGDLKSHGARPVHLIFSMINWTQTSRLAIKNSLSSAVGWLRAFSHQSIGANLDLDCFFITLKPRVE